MTTLRHSGRASRKRVRHFRRTSACRATTSPTPTRPICRKRSRKRGGRRNLFWRKVLMRSLESLSKCVARAIEQYAGSDSDVERIQKELFVILNAISPNAAPNPYHTADLYELIRLRCLFGSPPDYPEGARTVFRKMTGPREPSTFGFQLHASKQHWSRKAARLSYLVRILAEYALELPGVGETSPQNVQPPRRSPATVAQEPFQEARLSHAVTTTWDLASLNREIDSELEELNLLREPDQT